MAEEQARIAAEKAAAEAEAERQRIEAEKAEKARIKAEKKRVKEEEKRKKEEEEERKRRKRMKPFTLKPTDKKPTSTAYQFGDMSKKRDGVPIEPRKPLEEKTEGRNLVSASATRPRGREMSTNKDQQPQVRPKTSEQPAARGRTRA